MPDKKFVVWKKLIELKLTEPIEQVYCYMDHNKQTITAMYNDEIKLPINFTKMVQRHYPNMKISSKKVFSLIKDIRLVYTKENIDNIIIEVEMNF